MPLTSLPETFYSHTSNFQLHPKYNVKHKTILAKAAFLLAAATLCSADPKPIGKQAGEAGIRHSFLITGPDTVLVDESGKEVWRCRGGSRDGFALDNGNFIIAWKNEVLELTRENKVKFRYRLGKGNREIGTVAPLPGGNFLITELGPKPRLLEVGRDGKIAVQFPLKPETDNAHMQTRMARKNSAGNYWVPHLMAHAVKEYNLEGEVLRTIRTDIDELGGRAAKNWPFTAIELGNGNLLVGCTLGNKVVEFNPEDGKVVWKVDNQKAGGLIKDACGVQRLASGNTVVTSYRAGRGGPKMIEVDREGQVVWKFESEKLRAVHHFQVLTTNGKKEADALK